MISIPMLCLHVFIIFHLFSKEISGFQRSPSHPWLGKPFQTMFVVVEMIHIYNCFGIAFCKRTLLVFKTQYVMSTFTSNKPRQVTFQDYSIFFGFHFISFFIFSCYYLVALPILCILFMELTHTYTLDWNEPFESWYYVVWTCILLAQGCVALYLTIHIFKKISWQTIRFNYPLPHYGSLSTFDPQRPSTPSHNISQNKSRKSIDRSLLKNESCSIELNHVADNNCNLPFSCHSIDEHVSLLE
ncbi:hypothetical protein RFI_13553 [Reticulomyxa filosa]|uniref:Uncharacterized protein n=1 Tax=Reticulomyxa filosa TaxID=46433 RepID=X6NC67_RETFI|nr:hypothetical protein RFI_13553 [Reticulomyxa filosa]|eukprot:ETO23626.1 hypothetical protein RFI_13553 [Reticulomyxa filosa]